MAKLLVVATGLFFVVYGLAFAALPVEMATLVTDGSTDHELGCDRYTRHLWRYVDRSWGNPSCCWPIPPRPSPLCITGYRHRAPGSLAAGRSLGMMLDGAPNLMMYLFLISEVVFAALALLSASPGVGWRLNRLCQPGLTFHEEGL